MKQYLLFDLDGTLTDPMVGITSSVQYALEKFGIHVRYLKELIPFIGPPLAESFQKFYGFSKEDAEKAIQYYREYYAPKGIFENEVYEGIPEMLAHLTEAGFTLLVATSKPTVFARKVLKHFGMEDYFSFVGGSELDGSRTKKAEVISYILKTCGIEAKEAIMIGDRRHDIEGGKACGLESVGVLYGYGTEQELTEAGADHIIRTVAELEDYLRNQGENPAKLTWYDRLKGRTEEGKETDMIPYMETLGTIRRATLQYCQYSSRYDNYKRGIVENAFKPELSNGALMDIGVYVVSCMIRLFGAPKSIKASGVKLHNGVDGAGTILMEYPDMIGEAIYSKITDSAMPSQIQGEDASMLIQEIENVKDLRIVRKGVVQSIHFEQSDNILNYETQEFIKMIKTGMGWEKSKEITLETMKVLDEARKQLHIVFPADKKPKEKKK